MKEKDCLCDTGDFGYNSEMMLVCYKCGVVKEATFIDFGDETSKYEDSPNESRCNGFSKTSYMSHENNLSINYNNKNISTYVQNLMKWSAFTQEDLLVLKVKDLLESKSHDYGISTKHITVILNKYKKLLDLKKNNKDANFKGKHTKGILAVFAYIAMNPVKKEIVCEIFDIPEDFVLFNKCCKIYKDLFNEDVNQIISNNDQVLTELLEKYNIPFNMKTLIQKGYKICKRFNVMDDIHSKKNILVIMVFFLKELNYNTVQIESENLSFCKSKKFKQSIASLNDIKYEIFKQIKTL